MENEIERFDQVFGTDAMKHIKFEDMKILTAIFKGLGDDLYIMDDEYEQLRHQKIKVESNLVKTFSDNQEKLYTDVWNLDNKLVAKRELQLFKYGFVIAQQLNYETKQSRD